MMLCIVIKGPTFEEACEQISSAIELSADLVELRIDCFTSWNIDSLKNLQLQFSIPMIFTLRGGSAEDISLIATLQPAYLDIESHMPASLIQQISSQYPEMKVLLSYHNFKETPTDLEGLYSQMAQTPAALYKIATHCKSSLDAMRLLLLSKKHASRLIAIGMGQQGHITRILAPVVGSALTFASLDESASSAPGQLPAKTLLEKYHYRSLHLHTAIYGLIGDPLSQSRSDIIHNHLMGSLGEDAIYIKVQITAAELPCFLQYAKQLPFKGLSVTMPLKEQIMAHLDEIDPEAKEIGAVNTLLFKGGKISGYNTDGKGALGAIEERCLVRGKRVLIIGAGGAAKAIGYEAKRRGARLTFLSRDGEKALTLAKQLDCRGGGLEMMASCYREGYDILLNCTPIELPLAAEQIYPGALIMDIKTRPKESGLTKAALEKGCPVVYGYQMFIGQLLGQYALWFKDCCAKQRARKILEESFS